MTDVADNSCALSKGAVLRVPQIAADTDALTAALAYAEAGWFVLPVKAGGKNPGSVVGQGWPDRSSRDPKEIAAWYPGTDHGVALHVGRSGAVVFDVDVPSHLPGVLIDVFRDTRPPFQATRAAPSGRGHFLYRAPNGRVFGNSVGKLGGGWGQVRGGNGVIVVAPSVHPDACAGGAYRWVRDGVLPVLPAHVADLLPEDTGAGTHEPADADTVAAFVTEHDHGDEHRALDHICRRFTDAVDAGASRHDTTVNLLCLALKEAGAGFYPARNAVERLKGLFLDSVRREPGRQRAGEWNGILRYAVAAAMVDDADARRADFETRSTGGTNFTAPAGDVAAPVAASRSRSLRDRLLTREQLRDLPEPEPLIDRTLDRGTVAMLAGYTGTCKSFTALSWAASVATGAPWHYRQACVTGTALYVAAEGASGINSRLSAWESHNGTKVLDNALITLPNPINLGRLADVAELCSIVDEQKVLFVVIDTLNRCAVGLDENSAKDMGVVVDSLYAIQQCTSEHRGTVLLVHHTGKDKATIRGSSALEAGVDTVYAADGNPRAVRLYRTKRKDGPADDVLTLRLDKVANSAVLVHALADMTANEDQLMSAFLSIFGTTGASKAELRSACEIPPASFHRALNELVKRGVLLNTGTDKRPFYIAGVLP